MSDLKIIGWTSFDTDLPMVRDEYEFLLERINLIIEEIIKNDYYFSGESHQFSNTGVPVFSDGVAFKASMRAWGQIMAMARSKIDNKEYSYMSFYTYDDYTKMPEASFISVEANTTKDRLSGCTIQEDIDLINEVLSCTMPFITMDKVLKEIYENAKK